MDLSGQLEMPGEEPLVPNEHGGRQDKSGCFGEEENLLPVSGFKPWTIKPVAYLPF